MLTPFLRRSIALDLTNSNLHQKYLLPTNQLRWHRDLPLYIYNLLTLTNHEIYAEKKSCYGLFAITNDLGFAA